MFASGPEQSSLAFPIIQFNPCSSILTQRPGDAAGFTGSRGWMSHKPVALSVRDRSTEKPDRRRPGAGGEPAEMINLRPAAKSYMG
jgi:hypothetical protein